MSSRVQKTPRRLPGPAPIFPVLAPFNAFAKPMTYALLRAAFGLTIMTHGIPKLRGAGHGSIADPMAASTNLIENTLNLPFAPQLGIVSYLETFGGLAVAAGLVTRLVVRMIGAQMLFIIAALWPTYPWIDRGVEYPLMLGFTALLIAFHGSGRHSADALIGRKI